MIATLDITNSRESRDSKWTELSEGEPFFANYETVGGLYVRNGHYVVVLASQRHEIGALLFEPTNPFTNVRYVTAIHIGVEE